MALTLQQRGVMEWLYDSTAERIALLQGDVRSGKSWIAAAALLTHSLERVDQTYYLVGQSRPSLERSVMPAMRFWARLYSLSVAWAHKEQGYRIGANLFIPAGAGTDHVGETLMGGGGAGALFDEATLLSREVIDYVLSRIDQVGAIILFTFNPHAPGHWLRQDWLIGGELPHVYFDFPLEEAVDAGIIDSSVRDRLHRTLSGHRKARWLGTQGRGVDAWAGAAGLCLPSLVEAEHRGGPYRIVEAGCDFGLANPTAGVFWGLCDDNSWETAGEYFSSESGLTASDHADSLINMGADLGCSTFVCDPAALPLRNELLQRGAHVVRGDNDVIEGLDLFEAGLSDGTLRVTAAAPNLLREGGMYRWSEDQTKDRPVKEHDHSVDGGRYWVMHRLRPATAYIGEKPRGL